MASIDLTKLQPGKTYNILVRAIAEDGTKSANSLVYTFTTPSATLQGAPLTASNAYVTTQIAGNGALIAGAFDETGLLQAGSAVLLNIWNGTASLSGISGSGGVIINQGGILGYRFGDVSSSAARFLLDTKTGDAYFRGTIIAPSGSIGGWAISSSSLYNSLVGLVSSTKQRINLVKNPSFETGTTFWGSVNTGSTSYIFRDVLLSKTGAYSLVITGSTLSSNTIVLGASTNVGSINPGDSYFAMINYATNKQSTASLRVQWLTNTGSVISTSSTTSINIVQSAPTVFKPLTVSDTAPANAASAKIIYLNSQTLTTIPVSSSISASAWIDSVLFENNSTYDNSYFDGDSPGALWDGSRELSTSRLGTVVLYASPQYNSPASARLQILDTGQIVLNDTLGFTTILGPYDFNPNDATDNFSTGLAITSSAYSSGAGIALRSFAGYESLNIIGPGKKGDLYRKRGYAFFDDGGNFGFGSDISGTIYGDTTTYGTIAANKLFLNLPNAGYFNSPSGVFVINYSTDPTAAATSYTQMYDGNIQTSGSVINSTGTLNRVQGALGTTTIGSNLTVTHNLGTTPSSVVVSARSNAYSTTRTVNIFCGNIGATTFTVYANDGAAGLAQAFSWMAVE